MNKLKSGDILVFKAGDDWIGKSIAWLTDSDVSHAAMMIDGGRMIEMGPGGIIACTVEQSDGGGAVLLRLSPAQDAAPLAAAAQKYLDKKTPYDFPALLLLAGLIIYRKIRPTPKLKNITDIILRAAIAAVDKLMQLALKNPDKAMVCSQLVYQVYEDCGKGYHIEIENGLVQNVLDTDDGSVCLADLAKNAPELDMAMTVNDVVPDDEAIAEELYIALTEPDSENSVFTAANLDMLPSLAKQLLEKLEEFLEKSKSNIPVNALFIAPSDLMYKSKNLENLGEFNIERQLV